MHDIDYFFNKMQESCDFFHKYVKGLLVNSANPGILENITVHVYGSDMRLSELAIISIESSLVLSVKPFDASQTDTIKTAISNYSSTFSCSVRNGGIYVAFPIMTEEVRKEHVKNLKHEAENAKIAVRNIRRHAMDELKKTELPEDLEAKTKENIEDETHKFIEKIEKMSQDKQADIMKV